jgi:hypothetical protein
MKSKTLSAIAVAAAFGLSASAFAGSGHEVVTPFSPNESGADVIAFQQHASSSQMSSQRLSSDHTASVDRGDVGGLELSDATDWSASYEQMAEADSVSSDAYLVTWTPLTIDEADYYLIDMEPIAAIDGFGSDEELAFFSGDDYLALSSSDELAFTQEDAVTIALSESPVEDTAEVG